MSQVQSALAIQRKVWRQVSHSIVQEKLKNQLPKDRPHRIVFLGEGSSFFAAQLSALSLLRQQISKHSVSLKVKQVPIIGCSSIEVGIGVIPKKGDWVFALSHRGKTPTTLQAIQEFKKKGAFTALVVAQKVVPQIETDLVISTSEIEKCEPHTKGMTSAICALTSLLIGTAAVEEWQALSEVADPILEEVLKKNISIPTYLIGEWEGQWIAKEIRLKLTEMAGLSPCVFGTEEFFHGPRALYQRNVGRLGITRDQLWYIRCNEDRRSPEVRADLEVPFTAKKLLSWVPALVELQWRVLSVALHLKKNPDLGSI